MPTLTDNPARSAFVRGLSILLLAAITMAACAETPPAKEDPKERLAKAEAMFQERCKRAGEFIYRTADNVEGVFLMKLRPKEVNYGDQYRMDDPYGSDLGGDGYILTFVRGSYQAQTKGPSYPGSPPRVGYRYVEVVDPRDGIRYRYTGSTKIVGRKNPNTPNHQVELARNPNFDLNNYAFTLDRIPSPGTLTRYGVTYDDISTREDRDYWIAGSSLRVVDLQSGEVMAERVGYMMDRGQGNKSGGRAPWLLAADNACPSFARNPRLPLPSGQGARAQLHQAQDFVEKVLKPTVGE